MVVDDDPVIRILLEEYLTALAYRVDLSASADECMERIRAAMPSAAIIDMQMPGTNGIELLVKLREEAATQDLPVILLSADTNGQTLAESRGVHADAYILKPFDIHEVKETLARLVAVGR